MIPSRKGVEMSMNLIIIIVMGLVVLAIIIFMVTKNSGNANKDLTGCQSKGGTCAATADDCLRDGGNPSSLFSSGCKEDRPVCCLPSDPFAPKS